jgi:outer membrane biosynthesis protein TonB
MSRLALTMAVFLFINGAAFAYAQEPARDSAPPPQQQPNRPREVPPPPRQPEVNPPRGQEETRPPRHEQEAKPPNTEKREIPGSSGEQKQRAQEQRGSTAQQGKGRPTGKSAHIPDPQFKANFGRQHALAANRVISTTNIVPNQSQFVYAGYTFIFLDPWPADWLFTDDCYVDYVEDEYFLFDVLHPGVRVALFVVR